MNSRLASVRWDSLGIVVYIKKPDALYTHGGLKSRAVSSSTSTLEKGLFLLSCFVDEYNRAPADNPRGPVVRESPSLNILMWRDYCKVYIVFGLPWSWFSLCGAIACFITTQSLQ